MSDDDTRKGIAFGQDEIRPIAEDDASSVATSDISASSKPGQSSALFNLSWCHTREYRALLERNPETKVNVEYYVRQ